MPRPAGERSASPSPAAAAEQLRRAQDDLAAVIQSVEGIVWEADARTFQFTYVSPQAQRLLGYPLERWLLEPNFWPEHLHPEDRAPAVAYCLKCTLEKRDHEFEYRMKAADGRWVWVRDIVTVVLEAGEISKLRGIMVDVTRQKQVEEALRETIERFELVAAGANDAIWDWDVANRKVNYSRRWLELRGFAPGEVRDTEEEWRAGIHPGDLPRVNEAVAAHLEGRTELFALEYRVRCKDGSWKWVLDRGLAQRDKTGRVVRMAGSESDVTERRRNVEELRESRRLLEKAQQVGRVGSWVATLGTVNSLNWSDETCRIFGVRPGEFSGRNEGFFKLVHPEDREAVLKAAREARASRKPYQIEHRIVRPDGQVRWVHEQADVEIDAGTGEVARMVGVVQDITERKEAEEEIKRREEHFRLLIENATDLITVIDFRGAIRYQSPASRRVLGMAPEELVGRSAFDFVHADDAGLMVAAIKRALTNPDSPISVEFRFRHSSGSWRTLQSVGRNIPGKAEGGFIVVNSRDVTDSRALEVQLAQAQKLQAVGTLAGGVAHDFNNLLGAILGNAELAVLDLPPNHSAARCLNEILNAAERAKDLVDRILTFSRPRAPQRHLISLAPVMEEVVRLLRSTLPAGIELNVEIGPDLPLVRADASQIHQIVLNLGTNAWHALEGRNGKIAFRLERRHLDAGFCRTHTGLAPGLHTCLSVSDTGKGMDSATLRRVFEPFFTTKPPGQGTGLGLSVVHGIVQSHGGAVVIESHPGQGTNARVFFPAAIGAGEQVASGAASTRPDIAPGHGERILFVDDEAALVLIARRALERMGYRVTALASAADALDAFLENPASFDLVVTDFNMPGISGLQFAERVLQARPGIPLVLASGFIQPDQAARAQEMGIRKVMTKPYSMDNLCRTLQRMLEEARELGEGAPSSSFTGP